MSILADIVTGESATGDVLFLLAAIAFVLAAIGAIATNPLSRFVVMLTNVGLALVAMGLLVL